MRLLMIAAPILVGLTLISPAAEASTPEAVAKQYMELLTAGKMNETAKLFHPQGVSKLRGAIIPLLEAEKADGKDEALKGVFGPDATLEAVKALSPEQCFNGFMGFFGRLIESQGARVESFRIIGALPDGKDHSYVVALQTMSVGGAQMTGTEVITLQRNGSKWSLMLNADLEQFIKNLQASVGR